MYQIQCPDCGNIRESKHKPKTTTSRCRSCARKHAKFPKKICKFCNKEFTPRSNYQVYCPGPHIRICPVCEKEYIEDNVDNLKLPPVACSYECRVKRTQKTSLEKYGCIAPGNNPDARNKAKETMLAKYGAPYAMQVDEIRQKSRKTILDRYGVTNVGQCPEIVAKRLQTNLQQYGNYTGKLPGCHSKINSRFAKMLESYDIPFEPEVRIESRIYDFKIGSDLIEINPTISHSCIDNPVYSGVDKFYHRDKSLLAEQHDYRCIHVWDWDDWNKIINLLLPRSPIYARRCRIYKIDPKIGDRFLDQYHLQRSCRGQLLYLGLVYEGELYQLMTFGRSRYNKNYDVEMMRLCTRPGYRIVGGASKLFNYATDYYGLHHIISYCDKSKFSGKVYSQIGMKFLHTNPPQKVWSKEDKKITANLLYQRGYNQLFNTNYDLSTPIRDLMLYHRWIPVYDCGQDVYVFTGKT